DRAAELALQRALVVEPVKRLLRPPGDHEDEGDACAEHDEAASGRQRENELAQLRPHRLHPRLHPAPRASVATAGSSAPRARYSASLLRSVRMLIPSSRAAWVRLFPVRASVSRISWRSTWRTVRPASPPPSCGMRRSAEGRGSPRGWATATAQRARLSRSAGEN